MKKKLTRLTVLLASAGLTLLGFNGCGTAKKAAREEARIRDSIEQARLRQEEEMMREAMRQDSIRRAFEDSTPKWDIQHCRKIQPLPDCHR